ncbi:MAG: DinB family protein [Chitinophaga sp.]|uniref:DinB family protein n=1 Tax=Chitinophaga sp. TaxID=1869181 RepID=UPI001B1026BF|nr:DinB family protein [Chitinophaga sp.]MBO9732810.1 DinB family protein [Chitinophaga sp.]
MYRIYRQGAVGALLDEYERAIGELIVCIADIPDATLVAIADPATQNPDCRSIQTVLAHVTNSMYSYAGYVHRHKGHDYTKPDKILHTTITLFLAAIQDAFRFTTVVFQDIKDDELERMDSSEKILTNWGQWYDIEQLMEHAIVHILRHRRQIERMKNRLNSSSGA